MQKPINFESSPKHAREETSGDGSDLESKKAKEKEFKQNLISTFKEFIIWVIIILILLGSLYGYTGRWPPIVVVESNSMMHGDDSSVGVMDTGDIVLVKEVSGRKEIKTYVEGLKDDYKTYGSYGDVIGFKKNGYSDTPVIHRAVVWIEYNATGTNSHPSLSGYGSFDIPSMGKYNVLTFTIEKYKPDNKNLTVNLTQILQTFQSNNRKAHGGFLTKGDNNAQIDQLSGLTDKNNHNLEPVKLDWVVGRGVGEVPGLGLIKLYITGETSKPGKSAPASNVRILVTLIVLIVIVIITLHLLFWRIEKIRRKRREEEEDRKIQPFQDKIINRISLKNSKGQAKTTHRKPREVAKSKAVSYLDSALQLNGDRDNIDVQIVPVPKASKSSVKKESTNKAASPEAEQAPTIASLKTGVDLKVESAQIKGPYTQTSAPGTNYQAPFSVARPRYPQAKEVNNSVHDAPRAKQISKEEMLSYLDGALEVRKKDD